MYIKSIKNFISDAQQVDKNLRGGVVDILSAECRYNDDPKYDSEKNSWGSSLPILASILQELPDNIRENCEICLEAGYNSDERADVVIIGKQINKTIVIIIENKQWTKLIDYEPVSDICVKDSYHDSEYVQHPCCQVSHYKYILDNTNGFCQDNDVSVFVAVFMHGATENEREAQAGPFHSKYAAILETVPVFVGAKGTNDSLGQNLKEYIEHHVDGGENGLAECIYTSERKESEIYRNTIANILGNREQSLALLDENQIAIFEEIRQYVLARQDDKTVFIVEGDPGTGKTFVAEALIAYLYGGTDNLSIKLVLKNKDPRRALQRMGMPGPAVTYGLKGDCSVYDCLICDESHRMLEHVWEGQDDRGNIGVIMNQSNVSVFFYDAKQRVHIKDYVTVDRIKEMASKLNIPDDHIIERRLEHQHRCLESDHFMRLIDRILYEPERTLDDIESFSEEENYLVRLVKSPRELFYKIKEYNDNRLEGMKGSRVLAGKGRTNGVDWQWKDDKESLRSRQTIGPFRNDSGNMYVWNLHNYPVPQSFASDDNSINLVGCLDTSQGLDFEYIGLILSPDIEYDTATNRVHINLEGHQQGDPNLNIRNNHGEEETLKTIIKNTYRVLASRGAKGCLIYCADEALQNYLSNLIPIMDVEVPDDYSIYADDNNQELGDGLPEAGVAYIGNKFNKSYHRPECQYAPSNPQKRVEFTSREEADSAGYKPCWTCNP